MPSCFSARGTGTLGGRIQCVQDPLPNFPFLNIITPKLTGWSSREPAGFKATNTISPSFGNCFIVFCHLDILNASTFWEMSVRPTQLCFHDSNSAGKPSSFSIHNRHDKSFIKHRSFDRLGFFPELVITHWQYLRMKHQGLGRYSTV